MSDFKEINQHWKMVDPLTVRQAAALIAGYDPNSVDASGEWFKDVETGLTSSDGITDVMTVFAGLVSAINARKLHATIRRNARLQGWDEWPNAGENIRSLYEEEDDFRNPSSPNVIYCEAPDWGKTSIEVDDLCAWLSDRGLKPAFFFPDSTDAPDYFNEQNPCYALELANALRAWEEVSTTDGKGKPKARIMAWLNENTSLSNEARERIAIVANWEKGGGATRSS